MKYMSIATAAKKWNLSERTVRNYCAKGKIADAFIKGKTWNIPEESKRPDRINKRIVKPRTLLQVLQDERNAKTTGGIYHKLQIELTYNSNHIEGSRLTHDQTRYIYETNTIGKGEENLNVDDILETVNHFRCIDRVIDQAKSVISEKMIKQLHFLLKNGTSDSRKEWFAVGDYKRLPNEVGGSETTSPEEVAKEIRKLLDRYNANSHKTLEEIIEFHHQFELIHPFQDGNGRVGRLIMLKECLKHNIVPFIIDEELKLCYYRGLNEWKSERGFLMDTCLCAQDKFESYLDYFRIPYNRL